MLTTNERVAEMRVLTVTQPTAYLAGVISGGVAVRVARRDAGGTY